MLVVSGSLLILVLTFAVMRPRGLPEAVAAVPAAIVVVGVMLVGFVVASSLGAEAAWVAGAAAAVGSWPPRGGVRPDEHDPALGDPRL